MAKSPKDAPPPPPRCPAAWTDLIGQQTVASRLQIALAKNRLTGSLLLVGPPGVGKTATAVLVAKTRLCTGRGPADPNPCGRCPDCQQVAAGTHPDLVEVARPADKSTIPVELLIGPVEARMRRGFCHDLHLRPARGRGKVAILHDADFLSIEAANCLLKTLEEPPVGAVVMLIGTSEQRQLPTIRSRCQTLRFQPPSGADAAARLRQVIAASPGNEVDVAAMDSQELIDAVATAAGDLHLAASLVAGDTRTLRQTIATQLAIDPPDPIRVARLINDHLDTAGKDVPRRREALRAWCTIAIGYYRDRVRAAASTGRVAAADLTRLDRTMRVFRELERNANLGTLVQCYAADLTLATTGDRGGIG